MRRRAACWRRRVTCSRRGCAEARLRTARSPTRCSTRSSFHLRLASVQGKHVDCVRRTTVEPGWDHESTKSSSWAFVFSWLHLLCSPNAIGGDAEAEAEAAILRRVRVAQRAARAVGVEEPAHSADDSLL